jgi:palmitoyltransferase
MGIARTCQRCCAVCERLGEAFMRCGGPVYVALAGSLIVGIAYCFVNVILPLSVDYASAIGLLKAAAASFLMFNIMFNYVMSVRTDPGSPTERDVQLACAEIGAGVRRFCEKCKCPKPLYTHHCAVCRRCVLKMDHHCPWVNNCVGHRNYRYFYNFLAWLWLGCLVICHAAYAAPELFRSPPGAKRVVRSTTNGQRTTTAQSPSPFASDSQHSAAMFSVLIAFSIFIAMCLLWGWHVYLTFTAQTSIDYYEFSARRKAARARGERWKNPHDNGWKRNFQDAMDEHGRYWWFMWAMPRLRPHRGSGVFAAID